MGKYNALFLMIFLSSCASIETVNKYDRLAEGVKAEYNGKSFTIFDDVPRSTALVLEGSGTDISKSIIEGLTLAMVDLTAAAHKFEGVLLNHLADTRDTECRLVRTKFISDGMGGGTGYEITYMCRPAYTPRPAAGQAPLRVGP